MVFIARTRSRSTFHRRSKRGPWFSISSAFHPPPVEPRAVFSHLSRIPPPADTKDDAPVRQAVECSHFFRRGDRIPLNHQTDAGGKLETFRHGTGGHQGNKGITHV